MTKPLTQAMLTTIAGTTSTNLAARLSPTTIVNVQNDFGSLVVSGDWTAALNAASAYILANGEIGTIVLPSTSITITDTWKIGDTAGTGSGTGTAVTINVEANGICLINYNGPLDGRPAIWVAKNKRFTFQNFSLTQIANTNPGVSIGIALGGSINATGSTECTGGVLKMVQISDFQTNLTDLLGAASEMTFIEMWIGRATLSSGLGYSTVGARFDLNNSVNHSYINCQFGSNDIGLDTGSATSVNVLGGGTSANVIDFNARLRCNLILDAVRTDTFAGITNGRFLVGTSARVTMRGIRINGANGGDNISISGTFAKFELQDSIINGYIGFDDLINAASITMIDNFLWTRSSGLPFFVTSFTGADACHVFCKNNTYTGGDVYDFAPNRVPGAEIDGRISTDDLADFIVDPNVWMMKVGNADSFAGGYTDLIGVERMGLHRVKCLSEARLPGQTAPFSTGENLRIQGKFATSNSLSLTFKRTVSVTTSTPNIVLGAGTFFLADVGKQVLITGGGNPSGDFNGCIDSLNTGNTRAFLVSANGQHAPNYGGAKNAVIGADEPDANYMVLVTGNVNETFWVDTLATTGFTVHSSNATSTATVTCLIIR